MVVSIPTQYRSLAQIWDWLPWGFLTPWNIFSQYTLPLFGHYFVPWQAVPVIYIVVSIAIVCIGKTRYKHCQINNG